MGTVYLQFEPTAFKLDPTNPPQFVFTAGSNFPVDGIAFDGGSTDEIAYIKFRATDYGSGNVTLGLDWYADSASSGNVVWGAQLAAITPDTDSQDIETKAFATANTVTDSHLGTTGQRIHRAVITISNLDSLAADDWVIIKVYRDASDTGTDTMTGDAIITFATVSYSDT